MYILRVAMYKYIQYMCRVALAVIVCAQTRMHTYSAYTYAYTYIPTSRRTAYNV